MLTGNSIQHTSVSSSSHGGRLLGNAHRKFDSTHECQLQLARREISSAVHVSSSEGNFVWETRKCISLILSSDVLTAPWPDTSKVSKYLQTKGYHAFTEQGYTRRVKDWWREGSIRSRRSSGMQVWTSWNATERGQGLEHLQSVIKGSTDKDSPVWDEVKRDVAFWRGTETGLLGLLTTDDQVFACDGSLADFALGGGAFCLTTGQSRYAKLVEG